MNLENHLIIALDVSDAVKADEYINILRPLCPRFKVGLQLFLSAGPDFVKRLVDSGLKIFLDLKLFDIPNTVELAVKSINHMGVEMFTVHASGGPEMLRAAVSAAAAAPNPPLVLGVTVLTSMAEDTLKTVGVERSLQDQVLALATSAQEAGCQGIVTSPREVSNLRRHLGSALKIVTPGVRPSGSEADDQKRVGTPGQAVHDGASFLVVGRPILNAQDPVAAARQILGEMTASVK